jgi:hypothetical protein
MKLKLTLIALVTLTLVSCKKDYECECTSVYYTNGYYSHQVEDKHLVGNATECDAFETNSSEVVTTCYLDDND